MKSILLYFIFVALFINLPTRPSISGEAIYAFIPNKIGDDTKVDKKEFFSAFDHLNNSASNLRFILRFNDNESYFALEEQVESDLNKMSIAYAKNIITKGRYYYNVTNDELLRDAIGLDKSSLIKSNPSKNHWNITKESKMIGKYLCYKATRVETKMNKSKKTDFLIEAWFTPQIPVSFGPLEYNGLPGLIIEVKAPIFTFYLKEIRLMDEKLKITPLKSKNIITEAEYLKKIEKVNLGG